MEKNKQLGIWMDHSIAYLIELTNDTITQSSIVSETAIPEKEFNLYKGEKLVHKKEQHQQSDYYRKLSATIRNYQEVVLFGPTDAKNELLNILRTDHLFENIKIDIVDSDKMAEKQMHTFVREFFK